MVSQSHRPCIFRVEALKEGKAFLTQAGMLCLWATTTAWLFGICPRPMTQQGLKWDKDDVRGTKRSVSWFPRPRSLPTEPMAATLQEYLCCLCSLGYCFCHLSPSMGKMSMKGYGCGGSSNPTVNPQHVTNSGSNGEYALQEKSIYLCKTKQTAYQGTKSSNLLNSRWDLQGTSPYSSFPSLG